MVFLFKCLISIALVYVVLQWRPTKSPSSSAPAVVPSRPVHHPSIDASRSLMQAGVDAAAAAARDRCLSAPRDCAAALQLLQAARER